QRAEGALRQFFLCDPGRKDAYPEAELNEFLDRFHVSEFDRCGENHLLAVKIFLDHLVEITGLGVENKFLTNDFAALDAACVRPGMARAEHELKFIFE